jgi:negative regulator of sigma E activity
MTDLPEPHTEQEHRFMARAGVWVVLAAVVALVLAGVIFVAHRDHTPELSPGQPRAALLTP